MSSYQKKTTAQGDDSNLCLKQRFLIAIEKGELGRVEAQGVIVTSKEFKLYFSDIKSQYVTSFMPASTIEPGRSIMTHTKFLFRIRKGVYRLHPDLLDKN